MVVALVILSILVALTLFWSIACTVRIGQISQEQRHLEELVEKYVGMAGHQADAMQECLNALAKYRESISLICKGNMELSDRVGVIEGELNENRFDR